MNCPLFFVVAQKQRKFSRRDAKHAEKKERFNRKNAKGTKKDEKHKDLRGSFVPSVLIVPKVVGVCKENNTDRHRRTRTSHERAKVQLFFFVFICENLRLPLNLRESAGKSFFAITKKEGNHKGFAPTIKYRD